MEVKNKIKKDELKPRWQIKNSRLLANNKKKCLQHWDKDYPSANNTQDGEK